MKSLHEIRRQSIFPPVLFFIYLGVLLLMSGIHTGLIVGMNKAGWGNLVKTAIPICTGQQLPLP